MTVDTASTHGHRIPTWTLGDRLSKALDDAGMGVQEMADYLGVSRNTVSTWLHDRIHPSRQTLLLWSLKTGVDLDWIIANRDTAQLPSPRNGDHLSDVSDLRLFLGMAA